MIDSLKSESMGRVMAISFGRWGRRDEKYKKVFAKLEQKSLQISEKAFISIIGATGQDPKPTTLYMWWLENREHCLSEISEVQRRLLRECIVQFLFQFTRGKLNDESYEHDEFDEPTVEVKPKKVKRKSKYD